ncbi:MAG: response regulator transcription factor [Deltaproteobacteria bacterium]|nr:response regulator transcription factor [Deltaproteobacteria bacterium]
MEGKHILVIDDDAELCELLGEYLGQEGFTVESVNEGAAGLKRALSGEHALVVLDVMLPEMNGFDVLRMIRERSRIPVLMLTARGNDVDRIVGLEMGADDYLPKPFNPRELVARIRAVKRRTGPGADAKDSPGSVEWLRVGDVELSPESRTVRRAGEVVELTSVEFSFLETLLRSAGKVVTREDLAKTALGRNLSSFDRSVDVHMSSLRRKLGHRVGDMDRIRNIRGVGYMYAKIQDQDA